MFYRVVYQLYVLCETSFFTKMASRVQVIAAIALLPDDEEENENNQERTQWIRPWLSKRQTEGAFHTLFQQLKKEDPEGFRNYVRLDILSFETLVEMLKPSLLKKDTVMRECIKPEEMCCLALRYFASGKSFRSLEYQFRISKKAISYIVEAVATAIIKVLGEVYLKTPNTADEWLVISEKFRERWNFPNGLGGVDGKHIVIEQPKNSGSHYRNYKGTDSIILLAMVGPEYEFLFADVGMNGRNSDGGNWSNSPLKSSLEKNTLNIPSAKPLPGRDQPIPYVCTGDDAFPLSAYMMKPYPQKQLTLEKRVFNYRLSRMRRISENAFGILANRWRVFRKPFLISPEKVKTITLALITLHNWLRKESSLGKVYIPPTLIDHENPETGEVIQGSWRNEQPLESWKSLSIDKKNNSTIEAKRIRKEFTEYFSNEGCISWQWRSARIDI